jgi:hypothetical protein
MTGGRGGNTQDLGRRSWTAASGGWRLLPLLLLLLLLLSLRRHHATRQQHEDALSDGGHYFIVVHRDCDGWGDWMIRVMTNDEDGRGVGTTSRRASTGFLAGKKNLFFVPTEPSNAP